MSRKKRKLEDKPFKKLLTSDIEMPDISKNSYHIEFSCNKSAIVEGCKGVLIYDENEIRLSTGRGSITFSGSNLTIRTMSFEEAVIEGIIISVEFT